MDVRVRLLVALSLTCASLPLACRKRDEASPVDGEGEKKKPKPAPKTKKEWKVDDDDGSSCPSETFCTTDPEIIDADDKTALHKACGASARVPAGLAAAAKYVRAFASLNTVVTKKQREEQPDACCYTYRTGSCGKGRPMRDGDALVLASPGPAAWGAEPGLIEDALMEHSSVATFAQLSLELMALGAPAELVEGCHRAALDELRHARFFFERSGRGAGPMTLPARPLDIHRMIEETIVDGCIGESLGAAQLRARGYEEMACDEERHAELAFAILAFLVGRDPERAELGRACVQRASSTSCMSPLGT